MPICLQVVAYSIEVGATMPNCLLWYKGFADMEWTLGPGGQRGAAGRAEGRVRGPQGLRCGVGHGRAGALDEVQDGAEVVGDSHLWSASGG